jgi:hypothetical protein
MKTIDFGTQESAVDSNYAPNFKLMKAVHELDAEFKPSLPLNIYDDLPEMPVVKSGLNGDRLLQMIACSYPEGTLYPNCRENRRKLYMSIYFLRTASRRMWSLDVPVVQGQFTKDSLMKKTVVGIRQVQLQAK